MTDAAEPAETLTVRRLTAARDEAHLTELHRTGPVVVRGTARAAGLPVIRCSAAHSERRGHPPGRPSGEWVVLPRCKPPTVEKTNRSLKDIEKDYGWPNERRKRSYPALRAVLHSLRDRLTVDKSAQLAAHLPLLVRGRYFDGRDPSTVPLKMNKEQFLERVRHEFRYEVES